MIEGCRSRACHSLAACCVHAPGRPPELSRSLCSSQYVRCFGSAQVGRRNNSRVRLLATETVFTTLGWRWARLPSEATPPLCHWGWTVPTLTLSLQRPSTTKLCAAHLSNYETIVSVAASCGHDYFPWTVSRGTNYLPSSKSTRSESSPFYECHVVTHEPITRAELEWGPWWAKDPVGTCARRRR